MRTEGTPSGSGESRGKNSAFSQRQLKKYAGSWEVEGDTKEVYKITERVN